MATLTTTRSDHRTSIFSILGEFATRLQLERRIRRDIARLETMSDHQLRDIGLHRGNIHLAARHGRL